MESTKNGKVSKTTKAGLQFPVGSVHRMLKEGDYSGRTGTGAAVYMAAVLEYLSAELMELAGNAALQQKKKRINPRHIMLSIETDEELKIFLEDVQIPEAGVMRFIHPKLLPPSTTEKKEKKKNKNKNKKNNGGDGEVGMSQEI